MDCNDGCSIEPMERCTIHTHYHGIAEPLEVVIEITDSAFEPTREFMADVQADEIAKSRSREQNPRGAVTRWIRVSKV